MHAIVINLASAQERMAFQTRQLASLGIEYQRLEAYDGTTASAMRPQTYWDTWQRPLKANEKACFLSHVSAWEIIARSDRPALILEDDAVLSANSATFLNRLVTIEGLDFVNLEVRGRKKLVALQLREPDDIAPIRRLYQDRNGSAAYILWPSGARKLLAKAEQECGLADAFIASTYELQAFQADPAMSVQVDRCDFYGIRAPVATQSSIGTTKPSHPSATDISKYLTFKTRRILAQLRMGLRQLAKMPFAVRRQIDIDKKGFEPVGL